MTVHFGRKIRQAVGSQNRISNRQIAEKVGMSEVNLYRIMKKVDVNTELLRKFSEILSLPLSYWFADDLNGITQTVLGDGNKQLINSYLVEARTELEECWKENTRLQKELNAAKDKIIQLLEKRT